MSGRGVTALCRQSCALLPPHVAIQFFAGRFRSGCLTDVTLQEVVQTGSDGGNSRQHFDLGPVWSHRSLQDIRSQLEFQCQREPASQAEPQLFLQGRIQGGMQKDLDSANRTLDSGEGDYSCGNNFNAQGNQIDAALKLSDQSSVHSGLLPACAFARSVPPYRPVVPATLPASFPELGKFGLFSSGVGCIFYSLLGSSAW